MRKNKSADSGFNVWRSYSDMMAGVLLLFVLLMCVTLFQAQKNYEDSIRERDEKIRMQEEYTAEILAQKLALEEQEGKIETQDEELKSKNEELKSKEMLLAEMAAELKEKEALLKAQKLDLDTKTDLLTEQQAQIDRIIGVKADVVAALQKEFENNNVAVNIDARTGALMLDANVMFEYDKADLTKEGKNTLRSVLPIYCRVLLEEDYMQYLAEIIIDGYTDTDGDYAYNLYLSQQRSLAVAEYLIEIQEEFLNSEQIADLEQYLTVNGHSKADPIFDAEGRIDKDASRSVEVKFRLKDDEMIEELNKIMSAVENTSSESE